MYVFQHTYILSAFIFFLNRRNFVLMWLYNLRDSYFLENYFLCNSLFTVVTEGWPTEVTVLYVKYGYICNLAYDMWSIKASVELLLQWSIFPRWLVGNMPYKPVFQYLDIGLKIERQMPLPDLCLSIHLILITQRYIIITLWQMRTFREIGKHVQQKLFHEWS